MQRRSQFTKYFLARRCAVALGATPRLLNKHFAYTASRSVPAQDRPTVFFMRNATAAGEGATLWNGVQRRSSRDLRTGNAAATGVKASRSARTNAYPKLCELGKGGGEDRRVAAVLARRIGDIPIPSRGAWTHNTADNQVALGDRTVSGVAVGEVSAISTEAVNGAQLFAMNNELAGLQSEFSITNSQVAGLQTGLTATNAQVVDLRTGLSATDGRIADLQSGLSARTISGWPAVRVSALDLAWMH